MKLTAKLLIYNHCLRLTLKAVSLTSLNKVRCNPCNSITENAAYEVVFNLADYVGQVASPGGCIFTR